MPYKRGPKKKFPSKNGSGTVFSTSDKKNFLNYTGFGEEFFCSNEDPNGMYTGFPVEKNEIPTQDADDL